MLTGEKDSSMGCNHGEFLLFFFVSHTYFIYRVSSKESDTLTDVDQDNFCFCVKKFVSTFFSK